MAQQALNGLARAAVGIGAGISLFQASVYNVDGGFRAVMFDRLSGVQRAVRGEGTHFRIPWVQTPHQFDVRIRPRNISSATGTKDLQIVTINLRVLSRPEEEHLPDIFSNLGVDYDERVLPSIGNEVLKAVVAQYNAEQLITKREAVSREVRDELTKRATEFHILLEDVSITDLKFGKEFTAAVESKQVAQQDSERARFLVLKAEQEKQAAIIRAEGESESARVISAALQKSPALVELRRIEAAKDIADTLSRSRNVTYLPSGGGQNMLLGLGATGAS
jgi:prohibitin 1